MTDAPTHEPPRWLDVIGGLVLVGVVALGTAHIEDAGARGVDALAFVCGIGGAASLVLWRRWVEVVTGVIAVALLVYTARGYPGGPALLPGPLVLVALGYLASRRVAWVGAGAVAAAMVIGHQIGDGTLGANALVVLGWTVAAVLAGQALRARDERAAAEHERAAHRAEQALTDERLRIAQDLHDSVAHAMATINVQAGVASHLLDRGPDQARESLEAIRIASRDALDELGAILGVLRDRRAEAPRHPVADLGGVAALVARARADGLEVELDVEHGDGDPVAHAVSTAGYRVVQEALTNTRRHAGEQASARVHIAVGPAGAVRVVVEDDGGRSVVAGRRRLTPGAAPSPGFGLIGMRERVESTGGSLEVGPDDRGGFRVIAAWPPRP